MPFSVSYLCGMKKIVEYYRRWRKRRRQWHRYHLYRKLFWYYTRRGESAKEADLNARDALYYLEGE